MIINLLTFSQAVLIGLKLFGVINCSWWIVFLPILAIPVWLILYFLIVFVLINVRDFLLRRLK